MSLNDLRKDDFHAQDKKNKFFHPFEIVHERRKKSENKVFYKIHDLMMKIKINDAEQNKALVTDSLMAS